MNNLKETKVLRQTEDNGILLIPKNGRKRRKKHEIFPDIQSILIRITGILAARAVPITGVFPLGLAFLTMERRLSAQSVISLVMVMLGYISVVELCALRYAAACLIYTGFLIIYDSRKEIGLKTAAAAAVLAISLADAAWLLLDGISTEGCMNVILDIFITLLGTLAFDKGKQLINNKNPATYIPSPEEKRSIFIIVGTAILGFRGIPLPYGFSVADTLGYIFIGISAVSGGVLSGVVTGLAIGILIGMGGELSAYTAVFGICGFSAALTARYGKYVSSAAIALTGALMSLHTFGTAGDALKIYEAPIAAAVLTVMPNCVFELAKRFTDFKLEAAESDNPYKEHVKSTLYAAAHSFDNVADIFKQMYDKNHTTDMQEIAELIDTAADRVCGNCDRINECWKRDFNETCKTMLRFMDKMETNGELHSKDADARFAEKCPRLPLMIKELNRLYEICKINRTWKNKLCESRAAACEQFEGIADILKRISFELDSETLFDSSAAAEIRCRLSDKGIKSERVEVVIVKNHKSVKLCVKSEADFGFVRETVQSVLGVPITHACAPLEAKNGMTVLQYNEAPARKISVGLSGSGKSEESGDSHILSDLCGGRYLAAISDGMGTGHSARLESGTTVALLEGFMDAGFDKTTAVRLINSAMVMKSAEDVFATVDMCMIDLYSGEAEFIKNGAAASYIKRSNGTETVRAASLPVGIIPDVETESLTHRLECGDIVVMVSDGLEMKDGHNGWLKHTVDEVSVDIEPQELADMLIQKSVTLKGGAADDDMTVAVLKMIPA